MMDSSNWRLHLEIFLKLQESFSPFTGDLFASRRNAQLKLPVYCSWKLDPAALTVDALSISWKNHYPYMFPPFALIPRCLNKLEEEKVSQFLIAPVWINQVWFPLLLRILVDLPILLPLTHNILMSLQGIIHPMVLEGHLATSGRMACLRISYCTEGLSDGVVEILRKSW